MNTEIAVVHTIDGNFELVLYPASIVFQLSDEVAGIFDKEIDQLKSTSWLPVWKQIKTALLSPDQFKGNRFADKIIEIPLETVGDVTYTDGCLQVITSEGNQLDGRISLGSNDYRVECGPGDRNVFMKEEVENFISQYRRIRPLFDEYVEQLGIRLNAAP
jgi:hypothetical protein